MDPDKIELVKSISDAVPDNVAPGAAGMATVLWFIRRFILQSSQDKTDIKKDSAESQMYENLRDEIARMGKDIAALKEAHKAEEKEWEAQMSEMDVKLKLLSQCLEEHKTTAIETLSATADCNRSCKTLSLIKTGLKQIVKETPSSTA